MTPPVHRLRPNDTVWTPPSVIFLDTETTWTEHGPDEYHRLRLWCGLLIDRRRNRGKLEACKWGFGQTPGELADWLAGRMVGRECVWLYAHNLSFDLVTTDLAGTMAARGWTLKDFAVSSQAPFLRLGKRSKTLTVVDSWSWLPKSLASIGHLAGVPKWEMPAPEAPEDDWVRYCGNDVLALSQAVLQLMAWWDERRLGRWTISGAGCGWNAFRHIPPHDRLVIAHGPDDEERQRAASWVNVALKKGDEHPYVTLDRRAVRGGRKDARVVSSPVGGPWAELDLEAAYPTVCRELKLPYKRGGTFDSLPLDSPMIGGRCYGIVAECCIRTDRPRYPVRWRGVTWYPVGHFSTTLGSPEISWARSSGHLVGVGHGQSHRLGFPLRDWARWVLDPSDGGSVDVPGVGALACRAWGRSVPGKLSARSRRTDKLCGDGPPGWMVTDLWDRRVSRKGAEVSMAGARYLVTYDGDTDNCYPAVLAWIESEVRVRLGRLLEALAGCWWTCDTDGLLIDLDNVLLVAESGQLSIARRSRDAMGLADALCDHLAPLVAPLRLRPKRIIESLRVLGPQHMVVDGEAKMSGVRAEATETAPDRFVARDWPKLKWQMQNSTPGVYRRPERVSTFTGPLVHRWVLANGETRPPVMRISDSGENEMVPWPETDYAQAGLELAPVQYRLLQPLC